MKNPLKLFHNLLFNSDTRNPSTIIGAEDEKITLFDNDITDRIKEEVGKAYLAIDDEYWKGSKSDNEYYLSKLMNISNKLIDTSDNLIEEHLDRIVKFKDIELWRMVYNNLQCVYESLIIIQNPLINYYCDDCIGYTLREQKYPFLFDHWAKELYKECMDNLETSNTTYKIIDIKGKEYTLTVHTANISKTSLKLLEEDDRITNAEVLKVNTSNSFQNISKQIFEWKGTPKDFVTLLSPIVESRKLLINENCDRIPLVKAIWEVFQVNATDKKTKEKKLISLDTLQTYFKKQAIEEPY